MEQKRSATVICRSCKGKSYERAWGIEDCSDMAKWLKWAYDQADRLDSLRESPPSILDKPKLASYW